MPSRNPLPAMKIKKPSRKLTALIRSIKDSDEFVAHIGNIAEQYRRNHVSTTRGAQHAIRRSIGQFIRHSEALRQWLLLTRASKPTSEAAALERISTALHGSPRVAFAEAEAIFDWLTRMSKTGKSVEKKLAKAKSTATLDPAVAAADALRATFAHHGIKLSTAVGAKRTGNAVALLLAIAEESGAGPLTATDARAAFKTKRND